MLKSALLCKITFLLSILVLPFFSCLMDTLFRVVFIFIYRLMFPKGLFITDNHLKICHELMDFLLCLILNPSRIKTSDQVLKITFFDINNTQGSQINLFQAPTREKNLSLNYKHLQTFNLDDLYIMIGCVQSWHILFHWWIIRQY